MAFRFRKTKSLGSGARLNVGKRSASIRLGGRGFGITGGTAGLRATAGLPGTGISFTKKIGSGKRGGIGSTLFGGFIMLVLIVALFRWMFGIH